MILKLKLKYLERIKCFKENCLIVFILSVKKVDF